ncbi:hypothetical protein GW17_00004265 [Ensete ventricosum]|nr:hypothetical protein GW17_00004265 [Ensete ventricosum]
MLPLRFLNSGIRAKVAGHGQAPCRVGRPRHGHLQGGGLLWPRPHAKGRPAMTRASSQGAMPARDHITGATAQGWPNAAQRPSGARGGVDRRVCRPLAGRLPVGKGNLRLHWGSVAAQ